MCPELNIQALGGFKAPDRILGRMPKSILLAFSGGADSSFLLTVLCEWCRENGVKLYAAHVNHSIRGDEALHDRDFCVESAEKTGIKCFVLDADVPALAAERKKGIEETAREVRYEFFRDIMEKEDIEILATAHNATDNLETMLFRFARGSSGRGLCGIPEKRDLGKGKIAVRPILSMQKEEILDICLKLGIKYVCDSTNADTAYSRNRIRQKVIPQLREINPSLEASAARLSALLSDDCEFIDCEAEKYLSEPDSRKINRLRALHPALQRRVLAKMIAQTTDAMPEYVHFEALARLIAHGRPHSSISLPGEVNATVDFDTLSLCMAEKTQAVKADDREISLCEGANPVFGGYVINVHSTFPENTQKNQSPKENIYTLFTQATLSSDKIVGKLFCRPRRPGDKIRHGGISKDVRKLMSEKKVPLKTRKTLPVVCDGAGVLWIPGLALRDGAETQKEKESTVLSCFLAN